VLGFLVLEYTLLNLPGVEHMAALMTSQRMLVLRPAQEDRGYHQTPVPKSKTPGSTLPANRCRRETKDVFLAEAEELPLTLRIAQAQLSVASSV
jgi:hypothetical protein